MYPSSTTWYFLLDKGNINMATLCCSPIATTCTRKPQSKITYPHPPGATLHSCSKMYRKTFFLLQTFTLFAETQNSRGDFISLMLGLN